MINGMSATQRVTVSLPIELFRRIETRRHDEHTSRSEVITELCWRGWQQAETERAEANYRAAYTEQPETGYERAFAETAANYLLDEPTGDTTDSHNRATR